MAITSGRTRELATQYGKEETDTGSTAVQIAILTERINGLTDHLRTHSKDFGSRRGLLKLIGQRKRLQSYHQGRDPKAYAAMIQRLGLRR
ncbi:MAG: 30S ribosomal protein S15 [Candidatus Latescibacterota bacterium]